MINDLSKALKGFRSGKEPQSFRCSGGDRVRAPDKDYNQITVRSACSFMTSGNRELRSNEPLSNRNGQPVGRPPHGWFVPI
jgi:hypothetical protein